jgi:type IV pilus assembly protein PilA
MLHRIRWPARNRRGFTLVELLVAVLILGILMAVALPLYLSAAADSQKKTCRTNMQTISGAVQSYRVQHRTIALATVAALSVNPTNFPDLKGTPQCPDSGAYSLSVGTSGIQVSCSVAAHGHYEIGIDSQ